MAASLPHLPARVAVAAALLAGLVLSPTAGAQSVPDAVADLREFDVTFEDGALEEDDLAALDRAVGRADAQAPLGVVVLAEPVSDFASADEFAFEVLDGLGTGGRVVVFAPDEVGIASAVDSGEELAEARKALGAAATRTDSFAAGVEAAVEVLDATDSPPAPGPAVGAREKGGGFPWLVLLVVLVPLGLVLWLMLRRSKAAEQAEETRLGDAERRVREAVDRAANGVLELAPLVDTPAAPAPAKQLFEEAAQQFTEVQEALEQADTRGELEAVYPTIVDTAWKLDCVRAALDGTPAPAKPAAPELFPAPPPAPGGELRPAPAPRSRPEPQYRGFELSPWLTTAAAAAISVLAQRRAAPTGRHRAPMPDDVFGRWSSTAGERGGGRLARRRRKIDLDPGSAGRGMGRRR